MAGVFFLHLYETEQMTLCATPSVAWLGGSVILISLYGPDPKFKKTCLNILSFAIDFHLCCSLLTFHVQSELTRGCLATLVKNSTFHALVLLFWNPNPFDPLFPNALRHFNVCTLVWSTYTAYGQEGRRRETRMLRTAGHSALLSHSGNIRDAELWLWCMIWQI